MLCRRVVTKDRRYITQITCYERGKDGQVTRTHQGHEEILGRIGEIGGLTSLDQQRLPPLPPDREGLRLPIFGGGGGGQGALSSLFAIDRRQLDGG